MELSITEVHARLVASAGQGSGEELVALRAAVEAHIGAANPAVAKLLRGASDALERATKGVDVEAACAAAARFLSAASAFIPEKRSTGATRIDVDAELLSEFIAEARDHVTKAESALLVLEKEPKDGEAIGTVFRAFHTVKGCAAILELNPVTDLAHDTESLLVRVRDGKRGFDDRCATLSLRSIDLMKEMLDAIDAAGPNGMFAPPYALNALREELSRLSGASIPMEVVRPLETVLPLTVTVLPGAPAFAFPRDGDRLELVAPVQPAAGDVPPSAPGARAIEASPAMPPPSDVLAEARSADQNDGFVRIRTPRLDRLIDLVGEIVIAQSMVSQDGTLLTPATQDLLKKVVRLDKLIRELQDFSMSLRMVPLKSVFQRMSRVVRDTARKSGHEAELVTHGEDTEIDRNMVDVIADPLIHMVRNAVDHGIEAPDQRFAAGKKRVGTVSLRAHHGGGNVVVELSDDGAGLDRSRLVAKAIHRGLISSDAGMSDNEVYGLIFEPGFSTKEEVTDISGRGVGMDVVRRSILGIQGRIDIQSELGKGTTFRLCLPLTLAITDGMLVRVGSERFIVPTANIQISTRPDPATTATLAGHGEILMLRGRALPLLRLGSVFGLRADVVEPSAGVVVVVNDDAGGYALLVDEILGQQQVVAKPIPGLGTIRGISGGAILGDGRVGLILDTAAVGQLARRDELARLPAPDPVTPNPIRETRASMPGAA